MHFIDYMVPLWLKLDAISTVFHEEVDYDEHIVPKRVQLFLEVMLIKRHDAVGFLPPILFHKMRVSTVKNDVNEYKIKQLTK